MLGIRLFAPTSSFHASLQTAFPRFHCQLAPGSFQPVEGTGTKIFLTPISRKTLLPDPPSPQLPSGGLSPPAPPHIALHFPQDHRVPWSGNITSSFYLSGPNSGCGFLLRLISGWPPCHMLALSALPAPLKPLPVLILLY